MREIRTVNGWGARCGCGGKSKVHITSDLGAVTPETSLFLCTKCALTAVDNFVALVPDQPPYWPGDEHRDRPYRDPLEVE